MVARVLDDRGVVDLGPDERGGLSVAVRLHRSVGADQRISA
jgi:hypothetical protein